MKYLYAYNPETESILYRFPETTIYKHFEKLHDNLICIELDAEINPLTVYLKENIIKFRLERPSIHYFWDTLKENWFLNLNELKKEKRLFINNALREAIKEGYTTNSLHYPYNFCDQVNMIAAVTDSLNPNNDLNWRTPFWCENKDNIWEYRLHTAEEIRQVMSDGKLHLSTQILKNIEIQKQIEIANTEEEVNAIVW